MSNFKSRAHILRMDPTALVPDSISGEAVTVPAGAAGVIVDFYINKKPIIDSNSSFIGGFGDTSLALTSTAFSTEVSQTTEDSELANGEYWVNYLTGKCRGKKADGSVSLTADYTVFTLGLSVDGAADIEGKGAHDAPVTGNPLLIGVESKDFDGSALPNAVDTEGDLVRLAASLTGVQYVMPTNEDGSVTAIYAEDAAHADGDGGFHMLAVRDDAPVAKSGADGDYTSLTTDIVGALWAVLRGYDSSSDSNKGFEVAPIWSHHVEETLADVTNETSATNYYYIDMDGWQYFSVDINTGGTAPTDTITITIEAGNQDDGTAADSIFFQDVTQAWFGVASVIDTDLRWERDTSVGAKWIRIKIVTAGGSNDQDYAIYVKKWY